MKITTAESNPDMEPLASQVFCFGCNILAGDSMMLILPTASDVGQSVSSREECIRVLAVCVFSVVTDSIHGGRHQITLLFVSFQCPT